MILHPLHLPLGHTLGCISSVIYMFVLVICLILDDVIMIKFFSFNMIIKGNEGSWAVGGG